MAGMRDTVQIHVTADLPIRARALPYANRAELRFGKAFPVALLVDQDTLPRLAEALREAQDELNAVTAREHEA
jgi:hypothetical protein